jgi:PAS domain S-box-containing protein
VYFANSITGVVEDGRLLWVWGVQRDITRRKLVEERLRESEQRFRTLAATVPQLIWTAAPDGSVNYLSDQWADYVGLPAERLYDWGWEQVVHPDDLQNTLLHWRHSIESGVPIDVRHRFRYRDGQWRWQLVRGLPIRDEDGQITRWVGTCTDIHEVEQREQDARFLAELGERIRLADDADALLAEVVRLVGAHLGVDRCLLAEVDEQGGVLRVETEYRASPQLASAAGAYTFASYPRATAELRAGHTLRSDDMWREPELAAALAVRSQTPGAHPLLAMPLLHEGRLRCALVAVAHRARAWEEREVSTLETAAERAWLAAERLRAAAALRESEARLQELYAREQAARAQAEEASRLKDEFLATLSHELRTPLTSILGYAHLLTSRPRDAAYIARALDTIERNARNQAQLIDDLLDVSRIETGKMRLEPQLLDLVPVVEAAVDALRPAIDAKALQLRLDVAAGERLVVGDPSRLQQVVWNLLSNAVKFTPAGGSIAVDLRQLAGQALLAVRDNGQGISPEFLPYVFERFRQAEGASTRANGGLGLGLAIVRHLIEMHGGTVRVHSDGLGKGAAFTVTLPLAASVASRDPAYGQRGDEAAGKAADECPSELSGLRVLVVDDQPDILALLEETLLQCGAVVRKHDAARAALAELRDWRPDLLLSDIAMPGEDGYWLIRHVRDLPRDQGGGTLAVALTAYVRPEDRARVLDAGFHHYMPKPVDPGELRHTLAHLVAAARQERLPEQALRPDQAAS